MLAVLFAAFVVVVAAAIASLHIKMDLEYINLSDLTDVEIVDRMRKCNYEQFKTLVRMHLSFELDLNTDEFDLPCHEIIYEEKGKLKKWNRLSKKHKHASSSGTTSCTSTSKCANSNGNSPSDGLQQQIDGGFLLHLEELKDFLLLQKNVTQEGIFRKTGSVSRQNELRLEIQHDKPLDLEGGGYSAHDCATVFKSYLADLPEPLLTDAHYPAHLQIAPLCIGSTSFLTPSSLLTTAAMKPPNTERMKREQHLLNSVQLLLLLLPVENRQLLQHIIELLNVVAANELYNKMSPDNLATLFSPHLICPRNLPPEALHYVAKKMSSIIAYMISKGPDIFAVPAKLATDIRAYFLERKRKKTMSPEQTLDDSISDISTVNTVYTFVDREKTAAAHTTNTTDTELAQLYAHIQSMPESSKKRRLIKQFNKQNGQGTPLQLLVVNRIKNCEASRSAKSIGDSIKKHIFHKGLMSRTPKRTNTAMPTTIETPNFSKVKNPKLRVLFQSPTASAVNTLAHAGNTTPKSSASATSITSSSCSTPYTLKTHPLQKSISSSSLLLNASTTMRSIHNENDDSATCSSNSSDGNYTQHSSNASALGGSVSAPVSRQTSNDFNVTLSTSATSATAAQQQCNDQLDASNCCVTPLKLITDAAKQLLGSTADKKCVAFKTDCLLDVEENANAFTPLHTPYELKSRYKSEPNLSIMLKEKQTDIPHTINEKTPIATCKTGGGGFIGGGSKSITRKLIKGVSMGNLKMPFSTHESTKRLVRTVSSTLKRCSSIDDNNYSDCLTGTAPLLEHMQVQDDLDDETFEDEPGDHIDSSSEDDGNSAHHHDEDDDVDGIARNVYSTSFVTLSSGSSNELPSCSAISLRYQQLLRQKSGLQQRNSDLITSTPSLLCGRRSMSPITKSTQRMPKAMQESIMTPRSRKPVMVLTTTLGSSDQNQTICQTDLSSFREQDEEVSLSDDSKTTDSISHQEQTPNLHNENATSLGRYHDMLHSQQRQSNKSLASRQQTTDSSNSKCTTVLTNNFKEYLLSRSVLTASPVDSSFSSQPDDFGSTQEIGDLDESQLSPSLLYCLDGNQPDDRTKSSATDDSKSATKNKHEKAVTKKITDTHVENSNNNTSSSSSNSNSSNSDNVNSLATNPFIILNNARKRAASSDLEKITVTKNAPGNTAANQKKWSNKENCEHVDGYLLSKKLLISEMPGETSF